MSIRLSYIVYGAYFNCTYNCNTFLLVFLDDLEKSKKIIPYQKYWHYCGLAKISPIYGHISVSDYTKTFSTVPIVPKNHVQQSYNCTFFSKKISHGSAFFCPLVYRNFPTNKIVPNHQGSHFQKYQKNNKSINKTINKRNCKIIETSFTFKCSSSDIQYTSSCVIGAKCVIGALFIRPMVPR